MPETSARYCHARLVRAAGLFGVLCAVYFLTYHGQIVSTDEIMLLDTVRSVAHDGTFQLALTSDLPNFSTPPGLQPVPDNPISPLQVVATAPLLLLAERLPGVGIVHLVWLFNIGVTALTAVVLYFFGVAHGYRDRTALAVALVFGLATYVWVYSQMLFRDPLLMLLGLCSVYAADRARAAFEMSESRPTTAIFWLAASLLALTGALLAKDAGNLYIFAILFVLIPRRAASRTRRWIKARPLAALSAAALLVAVVALAAALLWPRIASRLDDGGLISSALTYAPEALAAYLLSPGFSVWAFSPVLLLGLPSAIQLARARQIRLALLPVFMLLAFAATHATTHATYWYGGLGWGPRFLLPATPFLALWLLPIFERALSGQKPRLGRVLVALVVAFSVGVQLLGVLVPIRVFPDYLYSEGQRLRAQIVPWREGVWDGRYLPHLVVLGRLRANPSTPLSPAWVQVTAGRAVPFLCLAAGAVAAWVLLRPAKTRQRRTAQAVLVGSALAVMFGLGLGLYYHDFRYGGEDDSLWRVLAALRERSRPGDTVILSNATYRLFFLNYDKRGMPVYVLPLAEGEILTPGEEPDVVTDSMEERANPAFQVMLSRIAKQSERWWVVTEYSPFSTVRYRVAENYLARHYFPGETVVNEPRARLILYAPVGAPEEHVPPWPERPSGADFGAARLVGFDLPRGDVIRPGDMLPVSLLWRHDGWPDDISPFDYSVNVSLIDRTGAAVAQRAEAPLGSFGAMSLWHPGGFYRDNHALQLPDNLPPGDYDLWVLIFDWRDGSPLPVRNASAGEPATHALIATLRVE